MCDDTKFIAAEINTSSYRNLKATDEAKVATLLAAKDQLLETVKSRAKLSEQAAKNTGKIQFEAEKNKCHLERQASDNFNTLRFEAEKNKSFAERQLAECCCELKEKIDDRATKTDELIRREELSRLREELAEARQASLLAAITAQINALNSVTHK